MGLQTASQPKSLGDWAYIAVEKHFHKSIKHEADVLQDKDPEALHQMRVGMRRLRTAVTGFAPALDLPKYAREKYIGAIARTLGELRDLDVMKEALKERCLPSLPKSEQKAIAAALEYLEERRHQTFKEVKSVLEKSRYQDLKQAFIQWLKEPAYQPMAEIPILQVLPDLLLPQVSALLLHPAWLIGISKSSETGEIQPIKDMTPTAIDRALATSGDTMHDLRKQTKRVRYQMELFADFYGATYAAYLKDMKALQEILGEIQDGVVLGEFLTKAKGNGSDSLPPKFAQQLADSRYEAWHKWQTLQVRYLNLQIRQSFRAELLRPQALLDPHQKLSNGTKV